MRCFKAQSSEFCRDAQQCPHTYGCEAPSLRERRAESVVLDLMCQSSKPPRWRDTSDVAAQLGSLDRTATRSSSGTPEFGDNGDEILQSVAIARHIFSKGPPRDVHCAPVEARTDRA